MELSPKYLKKPDYEYNTGIKVVDINYKHVSQEQEDMEKDKMCMLK